MIEQINAVTAQGYRPIIYIDNWLAKQHGIQETLNAIIAQAATLGVKTVFGKQAVELHILNKLYVFRYGQIPASTEAIVLRRKSRIVPGPF